MKKPKPPAQPPPAQAWAQSVHKVWERMRQHGVDDLYAAETFFSVYPDTSGGWLAAISEADGGVSLLDLVHLLMDATDLNDEARALLFDFLDRHYFKRRGRGKPKAGDVKPWTATQTRQLSRKVLSNTAPPNWRRDFAVQLVSFRLANARTNRRPPIYDRTSADYKLLMAKLQTQAVMRSKRISMERAAEMVAPLHHLEVSTLLNYMEGRRGSRRKRG
jgi:hypothetical protein